uniref:Uncharacterized protein n=1 Tax=Oncorhynchus kisutch TaxID=8019 RepID=A0A8C7GV89_ONCKI
MIESSMSEYSTMSLFHRRLAGRSRNNPGRLKGVVSCTVSGRPTISLSFGGSSDPTGRTYDIVYMDPWEFPPTAYHTNKTDEAGSKDDDYFTEVNVGELLTYFLRIKDTCNLDDESESSSVSIGCCVDLYLLVKKVLTSPYEDRGTNTQSMDSRLLPVSVAMLAMVAHVKLKS